MWRSVVFFCFLALSPGLAKADTLRAPESFAAIEPAAERSAQIFTEAAKVFSHQRCSNCHPVTGRPGQGDRAIPHQPKVVRGEDGFGATAMRCQSCHMEATSATGVPGAPHWHLAPASMGFTGKSAGEICRQIKDPARNGDRPVEALIMHVAFDPLIAWAWTPGGKRSAAPGSHQTFIALINEWLATGANCPDI